MKTVRNIYTLFPSTARTPSILGIFAHPDDESLNAGGLFSLASSKQIPTYLLCLTLGGMGITENKYTSEALKRQRAKELKAATRILGVSRTILPDFPDGRLFFMQREVEKSIIRTITTLRPSVVITHDPTGKSGHPDHITTSLCVKRASHAFKKQAIKFYYVVRGENEYKLLRQTKNIPPKATHAIEVGNFVAQKSAACVAHKSQLQNSQAAGYFRHWFRLFDKEYLHLIESTVSDVFRYYPFKTKYLKFCPPDGIKSFTE